MSKPTAIFFGSFLHHSAHILEQLADSKDLDVIGVVTTPPKPAGRNKQLTKTPVHQMAENLKLPVFTPEVLDKKNLKILKSKILNPKSQPDFFVVAGYGKLLPPEWLQFPTIKSLNIHFSLLPKYRGAMPGEWAILMGETHTGVSLIEMSPQFDSGHVFAQDKIEISADETRETLYTKLYNLGGELFIKALPYYLDWSQNSHLVTDNTHINDWNLYIPPQSQPQVSPPPYAKLVGRNQTYIPWELVQKAVSGQNLAPSQRPEIFKLTTDHWPLTTEMAIRAFAGWPGIWTTVSTDKGDLRLKLLSAHLDGDQLILDQVQLEGQTPKSFDQVKPLIKHTFTQT